jgi:hypothetical protein
MVNLDITKKIIHAVFHLVKFHSIPHAQDMIQHSILNCLKNPFVVLGASARPTLSCTLLSFIYLFFDNTGLEFRASSLLSRHCTTLATPLALVFQKKGLQVCLCYSI